MLLLWIVTALAEPGALPTLPVATEYPEGVAPTPVAREMAIGARSADVAFALEGKPELRDGRLLIRGVLSNAGKRTVRVYLASDPSFGSPLVLGPRGVAWRGDSLPDGPRSPVELELPPGARVVYTSALDLAAWEWPPEGAEIDWSFRFWTDPVTGTLPGRLAPPAPPVPVEKPPAGG